MQQRRYELSTFDHKFVLDASNLVRLSSVFLSQSLLLITGYGARDRDGAVGRINISTRYFIRQ